MILMQRSRGSQFWFWMRKKNGEGKEGRYEFGQRRWKRRRVFGEAKYFLLMRRKRRKIYREGKYLFSVEEKKEKKNVENIWLTEEKKKEMEKEGNFRRRKLYSFPEEKKNREVKRGQYLEKENIWRRKIFGEGKYFM